MKGLFKVNKGRLKKKSKTDEEESKDSNRPPGWHRMQSDMANLELPENVKLSLPDKDDIMNFFVTVQPRNGYWRTATFQFKFTVPDDYPYTPPKITCQDKVCVPLLCGCVIGGSTVDNAVTFIFRNVIYFIFIYLFVYLFIFIYPTRTLLCFSHFSFFHPPSFTKATFCRQYFFLASADMVPLLFLNPPDLSPEHRSTGSCLP